MRTHDAVKGPGYLLGICLLWPVGACMSVTHAGLHCVGASVLAVVSIAGIQCLTKRHEEIYQEVARGTERIQCAAEPPETLP